MSVPLALGAYRAATGLSQPLVSAWLGRRARRGKEDAARLNERWGRAFIPRPPGRLLWLHGASVGESLALLSLVERAGETHPDAAILVTTGTRASAEVLTPRLPTTAIHQYLPIDTPAVTRAFIRHWRPDLGVFLESEVWPNLLLEAKAGGGRLALLSARMSEASVRGWARAPASAAAVFGLFDLVLARDERQADNLASLGARRDGLIDLKFGARPLPRDQVVIERFRSLGRRPIILAASTHPGEDELVLKAFREVRRPGALLIIAPRHPERGQEIAALAERGGFKVALRTDAFDSGDVFVADTVGELGTWYALADLALIGGSWTAGIGGHNPLEAARLGCPAIAGPEVQAWPVYREMAALGATRLVASADLAKAMDQAWSDPALLARTAAAAAAFVEARDHGVVLGLDRTLALLP